MITAPEEPEVSHGASAAQRAEVDPLLTCLLVVARAHGLPASAEGTVAGLPLVQGRLVPSLFERAAHRVGLSSRFVRQPIERLRAELLPAILLLDDGDACVLLERSSDGQRCRVVFPELPEAPAELPLAELQTHYSGWALYVLTLPLFRVALNPRFTRPFYAEPRTSAARTASG
ncbi:cysteine peptidase family C39 domain-containing protein [Tepidimonas charontis]|uniref:Type I secretion system ATPase n=1 Tax=Tepidimonas charontis TaxID=2267262 RepID=A0A554X4A8_9BURK|nr:hypothetical protein [Tepidimonas charontis]TSE30681.1 type I secretion system ATPase [Tepidimonas charontis]